MVLRSFGCLCRLINKRRIEYKKEEQKWWNQDFKEEKLKIEAWLDRKRREVMKRRAPWHGNQAPWLLMKEIEQKGNKPEIGQPA